MGAASLYNLWAGSLLQNRPSVTLGAAGDPEVSGRFFETPSSRQMRGKNPEKFFRCGQQSRLTGGEPLPSHTWRLLASPP